MLFAAAAQGTGLLLQVPDHHRRAAADLPSVSAADLPSVSAAAGAFLLLVAV